MSALLRTLPIAENPLPVCIALDPTNARLPTTDGRGRWPRGLGSASDADGERWPDKMRTAEKSGLLLRFFAPLCDHASGFWLRVLPPEFGVLDVEKRSEPCHVRLSGGVGDLALQGQKADTPMRICESRT